MAPAAVIAFKETREAFAKPHARQQLHASLDRWLDRLEAHMPDDTPSLEALTQAVFAMCRELIGKIAEALVAQRQGGMLPLRTMACPHDHCLLPARPAPPRTVHTMVGEVSLCRPYFYGPHCQQGFAPLDDALQLSERRTQWDMQRAGARLAAEVPFATAQKLFAVLTGLSLGDHTVHAVVGELSHALGALEVSPTAAEIAARVAEMAAGKTWRPVLVLAIDGVFVPTRPEEAKGFRFYLVDRERIVPLLSWYEMCWDEEVGTALRRVQETGLIPEDQVRLCVIADEAKEPWNQVSAIFPTAVQILDDYHCREHVHKVASLQFGEDAVQEQEWVEAMMARLFWGYVDWAVEGLQALQPRDSHAVEEIRKLIGFLKNSEGRLPYRTARKGGYLIGSGGSKAANQSISYVRLKRSGAWWYIEQANQRLALHCAIYNGTFESVFEIYKRKALQRQRGDPL